VVGSTAKLLKRGRGEDLVKSQGQRNVKTMGLEKEIGGKKKNPSRGVKKKKRQGRSKCGVPQTGKGRKASFLYLKKERKKKE